MVEASQYLDYKFCQGCLQITHPQMSLNPQNIFDEHVQENGYYETIKWLSRMESVVTSLGFSPCSFSEFVETFVI